MKRYVGFSGVTVGGYFNIGGRGRKTGVSGAQAHFLLGFTPPDVFVPWLYSARSLKAFEESDNSIVGCVTDGTGQLDGRGEHHAVWVARHGSVIVGYDLP